MGQAKEHYSAKPIGVDGSLTIGVTVAGFLCVVSGTLTITDKDGTVLVNALPVTAGQWTRIPLLTNTNAGATVTLGGGAAGTLF